MGTPQTGGRNDISYKGSAKTTNLLKKWEKDISRHFSKEKVQMAYEKMLRLPRYQGNASKNHTEILPNSSEIDLH